MDEIARGIGHSDPSAAYHVPDDELAAGSTLGGQKVMAVAKATGALEKVYSLDLGQTLIGTVLPRIYEARSGTRLVQEHPGTFQIHPEYQEHQYDVAGGVHVTETFFVLRTEENDPPAVYFTIALDNVATEPCSLAVYVFADLAGDTGSDVVATYDMAQGALVAWNESAPEHVRIIGTSEPPASFETTLDAAKVVDAAYPGTLSNTTDTTGALLGVLQLTHDLAPGAHWEFTVQISISTAGRSAALETYRRCPSAADALARTQAYFSAILSKAVVLTPNPVVNRGVLWAKANMLRVESLTPTGWAFTNDPTRSSNVVGRDTCWFAFGSDYITPDFSRDSLLAFVSRQKPNGNVVEFYDLRTGASEDYGLNISDNTPLLVLALWHHYSATGDMSFLRDVYECVLNACRHILAERNEQGLVWCTASGTGTHGIAGWRNVIDNYRLSGATTELNAECYAALLDASRMARMLNDHARSVELHEAAEQLRTAINTHLINPANGLYYLNIDIDGQPRTDVTCDLVFPVMFGVADEGTTLRIIDRLNDHDFWTTAGIRTIPRDSINYSPAGNYGLLGGVWVGVSFWYAFAASRFTLEFMDRSLGDSFRNYSLDPRQKNTVPGQFSEWLHGETLTNRGMMLSPWYPPRYLSAAIEGAGGFVRGDDGPSITPRLAAAWQWLGVRNLPYHGNHLTWFIVRAPDLHLYTNFHFQGTCQYTAYEEDITEQVQAIGDNLSVIALREQANLLLLVGNSAPYTVGTAVRVTGPAGMEDLQGTYHLRTYSSLAAAWIDGGYCPADRLSAGIPMQIESKGFRLLDLRQEF